jgi:hypothetical protein
LSDAVTTPIHLYYVSDPPPVASLLLQRQLTSRQPVRESSRSRRQGGSSSSWLMVSATAMKRAFVTETSRCSAGRTFLIPLRSYQLSFAVSVALVLSPNPRSTCSQLENVLVDRKGNIKISDFGLSALPQHLGVGTTI